MVEPSSFEVGPPLTPLWPVGLAHGPHAFRQSVFTRASVRLTLERNGAVAFRGAAFDSIHNREGGTMPLCSGTIHHCFAQAGLMRRNGADPSALGHFGASAPLDWQSDPPVGPA